MTLSPAIYLSKYFAAQPQNYDPSEYARAICQDDCDLEDLSVFFKKKILELRDLQNRNIQKSDSWLDLLRFSLIWMGLAIYSNLSVEIPVKFIANSRLVQTCAKIIPVSNSILLLSYPLIIASMFFRQKFETKISQNDIRVANCEDMLSQIEDRQIYLINSLTP